LVCVCLLSVDRSRALRVCPSFPTRRSSDLMLAGLLWLIVYDVTFTWGYVGMLPALMLLMLLPAAYLSVQIMRWWSKVISLSQKPDRKSTRLNSSHLGISYAVFCLKKKKTQT